MILVPLSQPAPESREPPCRVTSVYGVGVEVERKFVVSELPNLEAGQGDEIEQGYLAIGSEGEVRVRRKGDRLLLTAKRGLGSHARKPRSSSTASGSTVSGR